jgi:D-glycero-alpha-D-manno-heptose 1-phosphate guanylyltransferase
MSKRQPFDGISAVILAGGLGTRLKAAVGDRPKPLAQINGRPFLDYQIAQLGRAGLADVLICVGFDAQSIVDTMGAARHGVRLRYLRDWPLRGTGGALRQSVAAIDSQTMLVVNGDSYSNADLGRFATGHARNPKARCSMLLSWRDDRADFGGVTLADDGRVTAFQEKQPGIGAGYVNAGIYLFDRTVLAGIPADRVVSLERQVLPGMVGRTLYGWPDEASFIDIGTPESYCRAHSFLRPDSFAKTDSFARTDAFPKKDAAA